MKGTVFAINQQRGMVAVETENCDFSVFEMLGEDLVDVGDQVMWEEDTSLGSTILTNLTQKLTFEVYFQNHWVPKSQVKQQLFLE